MKDHHTLREVDESLALLADSQRRRVLRHLLDRADGTATVDELEGVLVDGRGGDTEKVRQLLHHVHLPKLRSRGVVEYDADAGTVRYAPDPTIERLLTAVDEVEAD